jgi:dephospho-CoA kinase
MTESRFIKVGLTGGIGSGKSTVSDIFKKEGIPIVDADIISRDILKIYPEINNEIKKQFGEEFFYEGALDRRKMGNYIFSNDGERKKLEDIMIPYIKKEILAGIKEYGESGQKLCILDAPTLIEHGLHRLMDFNIVVWVDRKTQSERVRKRDSLSDKEVADRINSQMPLDEKIRYADFVVDNSGSVEETEIKVKEILHSIK